jgi:hypothetical protein
MRPTHSNAIALVIWIACFVAPQASITVQDYSISVSLPPDWVPFRADVLHISDRHVTTGKFYRRRDGSAAHYLDTPGGPAVTIHNLATRKTYVKLGDRTWATRDVDESALGGPRRELRLPRRQIEVFHDAILGDVYEFSNPGSAGVVRFVPRLNGFEVSYRFPNGVSREYLNISIGDQPDHLFMPPPAAGVP